MRQLRGPGPLRPPILKASPSSLEVPLRPSGRNSTHPMCGGNSPPSLLIAAPLAFTTERLTDWPDLPSRQREEMLLLGEPVAAAA